jgi:hypothetical protein
MQFAPVSNINYTEQSRVAATSKPREFYFYCLAFAQLYFAMHNLLLLL